MLTAISYILKIEQKLHCYAYIQVHSGDVQLLAGIAVLYPQFGDVVTSIQKYLLSSGHWICREERHHDRSKQ